MTKHDAPVSNRARAVGVVVLGLSGTGAAVGALWALLAPSVHAVVAIARSGGRVHDYLGNESEHLFVAPFLMLGLLNVVAVIAPVLAWQWRQHRGPEMAAGLSIGLIAAAGTAAAVGVLLVRMRYGALDFDTVPLSNADHKLTYVIQAPPVFFARAPLPAAATLLAPAATASLVYALLACADARDDLGSSHPGTVAAVTVSVKADGDVTFGR